MTRLTTRRRVPIAIASAISLTAALAALALTTSPAAGAAELSPTPVGGSWTVEGKGNGHGHGLSQYGARGAAIAGLKYDKILAFYYPKTTLQAGSAVTLRVLVTGPSTAVTVGYKAGLVLRWTGGSYPVPAGASQWRLAPSGSGLVLQRLLGATWSTVKTGLPARADFSGGASLVRYYRSSATSIDYRGTVGAVRSGAGVLAINRVSLDDYTRGVAPREMPSSWQTEAVKAQAVAARSYARYSYEHNAAQAYDICDTTSCQVYGGAAQYVNGASNGVKEEAGSNAAVAATTNRILTYGGKTIFAQFSASNGGMTASSNQPYFVTRADPYDNAASGDPYLNWTRTVSAASVASCYGLKKVTEIDITARAGGSTWGGLVTAGVVKGLAANGSAQSINVTGPGLASAMGLPYQYFHIRNVGPKGHLDTVSWVGLHKLRVTGWTLDPAHTTTGIYVYVYVDSALTGANANKSRPDVQRVYKTPGAQVGFDVTVTVPAGSHRVCVYGVALNRLDSTSLGCVTEKVGSDPLGNLEQASRVGAGQLRVSGWVLDPDTDGSSGIAQVYIDGTSHLLTAASPRPDVQRIYKSARNTVGFAATLTASRGTHRVCGYAINHAGTPGKSRQLRCVMVTL